MKKAILGLLSVGAAASALAQGTVVFENSNSLAGAVTMGSSSGPYAAANSYTVALLWAPGSSLGVAQGNFTQIGLYGQGAGTSITAGLFFDSTPITTGSATAGGVAAVFEVEGWTGNYTSYAAAVAGGAAVGLSGEFLNGTGNPVPPGTPPTQTTGWDGNLVLTVVSTPEPGTLALGGLGAAALLFFRRRK
jgi:hypothetical protein